MIPATACQETVYMEVVATHLVNTCHRVEADAAAVAAGAEAWAEADG